MIAYLDIETSFTREVTVVGLLRANGGLAQLVGKAITAVALEEHLDGVDTLCTYNGDRFDLPVLGQAVGIDLAERFRSFDLWRVCRMRDVRGGLKGVEVRYAIPRAVSDVNGVDAMVLWRRWQDGDRSALETLLEYNRDDVVNLATLERRLCGDLGTPPPAPKAVIVGA